MAVQEIKCPHCGKSIPLDKALSEHLQEEMNRKIEEKELEIQKVKDSLSKQVAEKEAFQKEQKELYEVRFQDELKRKEESIKNSFKKELWEKAQEEAKKKSDLEVEDLRRQAEEKTKLLRDAQEKELGFRKKQRELEEKEQKMELDLQRRLDEEREKVAEKAIKNAEDKLELKLSEKDKQLDQLNKTIEDLRRKSEQGSMQVQGDAQEDSLRDNLKSAFPFDEISDVPTGVKGGDLVQVVKNNIGKKIGIILWESKNAKAWGGDWVKKLKSDQGRVDADICILASRILPKGVKHFDYIDGVWVCDYRFSLSLAGILRNSLSEVYKAKSVSAVQNEEMELLRQYLSGNQFKNRIENIIMAQDGMKQELDKEKRAMEKIWSRRAKEIDKVVLNTAGVYGDLQGIMGASLPNIQSLELDSPSD